MISVIIGVTGLALGSFVNALVWRVYIQANVPSDLKPKADAKNRKIASEKHDDRSQFSIVKGRSMCPDCRHQLAAADLVPLFSWLSLRGKCRYCREHISIQYPAVEIATAALFVGSYYFWPLGFDIQGWVSFIAWLGLLVGLMALLVYDLRWMLLPNRIVGWLSVIAGSLIAVQLLIFGGGWKLVGSSVLAVVVGGGLFWLLFELSKGRWIGGGDVKLGALIGLILTDPAAVLLVLFLSSVLGTVVAMPLLMTKRATRKSLLPYGPFLIAATIIVKLFGAGLIDWYSQTFLYF